MATSKPDVRLTALRRFAVSITVLNIAGHTILGFEQSWAQLFVAMATAYGLEILLEWIGARADHRQPRFLGPWPAPVDFILPGHITAFAVAMLLYANDELLPFAFATALAVASKSVFRVRVGHGTRHFLNPSNFGISLTLILLPWIGMTPPYQFTEYLTGYWGFLLIGIIVASGGFLNIRLTRRLPLILAWVLGFWLQALIRSEIFGTSLGGSWMVMTGVVFWLYTFYMVTDPATTPVAPRAQVVFGGSVAVVYALLMVEHVVFGLFFALTIVCALRGLGLFVQAHLPSLVPQAVRAPVSTPAPVHAGGPQP